MKNFTHKRWTLLAIACLINLCTGSVYAWSVFAGPKAQQLSELTGSLITAGDLAIAFSVCNGLAPIPMILGGYFVDRLGPKAVIVVGGLFIGAGMFFSGASGTFLSFLISYGLIFGLGLGFTYGAAVNNTIKFFPGHQIQLSPPCENQQKSTKITAKNPVFTRVPSCAIILPITKINAN